MCRKATVRSVLTLGLVWAFLPAVGHGQAPPDWRHIGTYALDGPLSGSVSGPVDQVWYSVDGSTLFARTSSGRTYQTSDLENWQASVVSPPPVPLTRVLGLAPGSASVPGALRDVAASPLHPDEISVATDQGIFRSADGGKSWTGLNDALPNLPVRRLLAIPAGGQGVRIELGANLAAEWPPGEKQVWLASGNGDVVAEAQLRGALGSLAGVAISAVAISGDMVYAGTEDGRLRVSSDRGQTWQTYTANGSGRVERLWVDPSDARVALAVLGATPAGATALDLRAHVLHTMNGGAVWDNLTANLPDVAAHGIAADRASGAIYVATDSGVFAGYADLGSLGSALEWTPLAGLPNAPAVDAMLDGQANQLWVALDGFGVYAALAPHRFRDPRVVSAADLVARAVAPGSLISILGAQVAAVRAGDVTVPVLSATPGGSQLQVPFDVRGNSLALVGTNTTGAGAGASLVFAPLPVAAASPAIFVGPDATPMLLDAESGILLDAMTPAHSGGRIQILAAGLGQVTPDWPAGFAAPAENPPRVAGAVHAFLDRTPVEVTRAVLAPGYIGLYLVEITVPKIVNYGPAELYVDVGGTASNRVRVYIEP
ncbi:MAG TPA: hypothetical protein VGR73_06415 [Bryobacteraceae bacterium]|nr:hypothetical protein [Bryobacteraceae bacterium]